EFNPSVASAADGRFVVVWTDYAPRDGSGFGIFGRFSGGGDIQINSYTTGTQSSAQVASDPIGDTVIVWQSLSQDGDGFGVYAKRFAAPGVVSSEFAVNLATTGDQTSPSVSVGPSGAFMIVWQSSVGDGHGDSIHGRIYKSSGAPLTTQLLINSYTTGNQQTPSVAALDTGEFVVTWTMHGTPGHDGVYAQRLEGSGAPIGGEFRVNTSTNYYQYTPAVSAAPGGGFAVTWWSYRYPGVFAINAQRYDGGGAAIGTEVRVNQTTDGLKSRPAVDSRAGNLVIAWQSFGEAGESAEGIFAAHRLLTNTDRRANAYTTGSQSASAIAADSSGDTVVVWQSDGQDGSGLGVYGQRYDATGAARGSEFHVSAFVQDDQSGPSVASSAAGAFVVVWQSANQIFGYPSSIYARRYSSAGTSQGSEFLVAGATAYSMKNPSVSSNTAGDFVVVWTQTHFFPPYVAGRRYDATGAPAGGAFRVSDFMSSGYTPHPAVASSNGGFLVVWRDEDLFIHHSYIRGAKYDAGGAAVGSPFGIYYDTSSDSSHPHVATDANGNFVVVWQAGARDGSDYGVFGLRLDLAGSLRGGLFRVNTFTTGRQAQPSVSVDSSGAFVVTWQGVGQDGSEYGVYGQRYDVSGLPQGGEFRVNGFAAASQAAPAVAYANGKVTVAFQAGGEGSGYGIYVRQPLCASGDVDGSGHVDVADVFYLINTLFAGGPPPVCSGDFDASGHADVADVFYLINYLFAGGPPPL
ncbi:MAG TPA: hypothetical protein VKF32_13550, partial [Thermoanaerobaculia bacterium]|nr:hypothetical protein [Thermoanaerobaculia bacterium]